PPAPPPPPPPAPPPPPPPAAATPPEAPAPAEPVEPAAEPVEPTSAEPTPAEAWDDPMASPDAWVNPLAEESRATPTPSTPPPAWQVGSPIAPGWGEPAVTVPARPDGARRPIVLAAAVGAVVGALVAGLLVAAVKDNKSSSPGRTLTFSNNTSKIARTGDIQEILAKVEPAVVAIRTRTLSLGDFLRPVPGEGAGTGFVIGSDGAIVTNNHVVAGAQTIEVVFADDRKMPARVLGRDPTTDLAVLKVDASDLPVATLGDSGALKVGDDVIAIGNALALEGGPTVTRGIVSAEDRTITAENGVRLEHVIQTDTAINPGNSGGPLVNSAGEVVGINTAVAGDAQNIGFSIAVNAAKPIIEELRQGTTRSRPFLGVKMFTLTPSIAQELGVKAESGALVADVTAGSGAEVAGLRNGDVITSIDGKEVKAAEDVTSAVNSHKPGDEIKVSYRRGDETSEVTVKLGERPVDAG
ncbi:MAG TPA: trypsin-like peptidase domain-containing protein, partial [Acidimicrobiia bacterium]|nr:trypsin-like peptidase domain-containing protein [Acidimicrobiia bacterium]